MIQKLRFFFESSIRNKLMVALPLVIAFVIIFLFTLSILTLRKSVYDHVIEESKDRFYLISNYLDDDDLDFKQRELLFKSISYIQTFDDEGTLHLQRGNFSDYHFQHRNVKSIYERNPQGLSVLDVSVDGQRFIELEQWINKKKLVIGFPLATSQRLLFVQTLTLIGIALVTIIASFIVISSMGHIISEPVCQLAEEVGEMAERGSAVKVLGLSERQDEVGLLAKELNNLLATINQQQEELTAQKMDAALGKIATQVAHDIRGPLSSMQTALGFFGEMKVEDKKFNDVMNLLQLSSKRLSGIADGLLKKHTGKEEQAVIFSLHKILDELIGEYHGQYKTITFIKKYPSRSVELHGDPAKLQRVFGNIIKNAAEAIEYKGTITITTDIRTSSPTPPFPKLGEGKGEGDYIGISISDTGPGMSAEILECVLSGGYTEGKKDGHGIGMMVVRETIKESGGDLTAASEIGKGTAFFITLPLPVKDQLQNAAREKTVIEQITIYVQDNEPVIIIDDDPSLREQWRMVLKEKEHEVLLCESYEDFQNQKITTNISHTAIVDYHFDNSEKTGGDVLAILKQQGFTHLYLCTAEYWKPSVQKLAEDLNLSLCPKPLPRIEVRTMDSPLLCKEGLGEVETLHHPNPPLAKGREKDGYTVLVIDDDEGVRMSWEMMRERLGIADLHCYPNMEAMKGNGVDLNVVDIAFVDKNIEGSAFTGAAVLSFLKDKCAGKIVLASGENEKELRKDPQFSEVDFIVQDKIPSSLSKFF